MPPPQQRDTTKVLDLQHAQQPFFQEEAKALLSFEASRREETEQLSPLNYEEFLYQQQLIEELIAENTGLKRDLATSEAKLGKVEH
jgi:hypothetical protein